jgi:hypothetical protein
VVRAIGGQAEKETGRQGDRETGRQGDKEENTSRTSPTPYAVCPSLLYFATKVAKSGKSIGLEI